MPKIDIDESAHRILLGAKAELSESGIRGSDFSDAIRHLDSKGR